MDRKHGYVTMVDNKIIQVGAANDLSDTGASAVTIRAWRQVN
ncbi:MAG: hypothetical protein ACMUIP_15630 [bacterium]